MPQKRNVWTEVVRPYFVNARSAVQTFGTAPRSNQERQLLSALQKSGIEKASKDKVVDVDIDNEK